MAGLPPLNEETCPPGTVLRSITVTFSRENVLRNIAAIGDTPERYREGDRLRVPDAMLLGPPVRLTHNSFTYDKGIDIGSNAEFRDVAWAGEDLTVAGVCQGSGERNRNTYHITEVTITGADGRTIVEIEHASLYSPRPRGNRTAG